MTRAEFDYSPNDPEQIADPCPFLRDAREHAPVFHSPRHDGFWTVTRYRDIWEANHDQARFTSSVVGVTMPQKVYERDHPYIPVETDDPIHSEYRNIVAPLLARSSVLRLQPQIRSIAAELLDSAAAAGRTDLVQDFALPMVSRVLMLAMGMPASDAPRLLATTMKIFHGRINDPKKMAEGTAEFNDYLDRTIQDRIDRPRDENDLFTRLVTARIDGGRRLDRTELHMYGANIFTAGFETTINGIGTSLWHLATDERLRAYLASNPDRIPRAVEEFLRYFTPVQLFGRNATVDFEYGGQQIAEGEAIFLHYGSGNRDDAVFDDPDGFDAERWPNRHLAFGSGIHFCMGAHLARLEMTVAIGEVLDRFPRYRIDGEVQWAPSGDQRGLWHLPVELDPAQAG